MSFFFRLFGSQPQPATEPPRRPAFDLATLVELFAGAEGTIVGLLTAAIASIRNDVSIIAAAANTDDRYAIVEAAHRLKGTSGSIGAWRLVEISSQIEAAVTQTRAPLAPPMVHALREAAELVSAEIGAYAQPPA